MILQKWKQCGVRVQGKDHVAAGVPCQDNVAYAAANGVQAIALSDGGGSRKFSEVGSEFSTRAVCELLTARFDYFYTRMEKIAAGGAKAKKRLLDLRLEILDYVLDVLRAQTTAERALPDFGCTLQFCAVKEGRYFAGHIGDGVIAALYQVGTERRVEVLSHPENGGAPNVTFFLTDNDACDHLRLTFGECRQLEGVLMMSDGPEEVLYAGADGMHPNTLKLFDNFHNHTTAEYAQIFTGFLSNTVAKHSYDDLSLNLLYLENAERGNMPMTLENELFSDIHANCQVTRVSSYAYFLDPTVKTAQNDDLSFLRS